MFLKKIFYHFFPILIIFSGALLGCEQAPTVTAPKPFTVPGDIKKPTPEWALPVFSPSSKFLIDSVWGYKRDTLGKAIQKFCIRTKISFGAVDSIILCENKYRHKSLSSAEAYGYFGIKKENTRDAGIRDFWDFVDNDNPYSQFETAAKVFLEKRDQGEIPKNKILFFEDFAKLNFAQASLRMKPDATIYKKGSGDGYYEGNSDFDKNGDEVISGYEIPLWYKKQFEKTQYKYIPEFIQRCKNDRIVSIRKLSLSAKKRMFGLDDDAS